MYTAEIRSEHGRATLTADTLEMMYRLIFDLNQDVFVNGVQVKARNGQMPGVNGYFAGYTRGGLAKLYENAQK
jgi:hypothetical protein